MYTNWLPIDTIVSLELKWYHVSDVIEYIYTVQEQLFTGDFRNGRFELPSLKHVYPATEHHRFQEGDTMICESIAPWSKCLPQLFYAASLVTNPKKLQGRFSNTAPAIAEDDQHPEIVLLELLAQALHYIELKEGVFEQYRYEKRYKLEWADDYVTPDDDITTMNMTMAANSTNQNHHS